MSSNLVPEYITDRNGHRKKVWRNADGKGNPSIRDRAEYKRDAARVPAFSPYKRLNVVYADDFYLGEGDTMNGISYARLHDDGNVELINYAVESNIDLTSDDMVKLVALIPEHQREGAESITVELSSGTARLAADGALIFSHGDELDDVPPYETALLLAKLSEWL